MGNSFRWLVRSRRRTLLIAVGLLAVLDLGRSLLARVGYAEPVEHWQPDQRAYADIAWPPGTGLPAGTPSGARLYAKHCAVCHGPDGRGNGPAAPSLIPRPTDFTLGQFKYKSTAPGTAATDADIAKTISDGLPASSMPYWRDLLSEAEIHSVAAYVKAFAPAFGKAPPARLTISTRLAPNPASIARGRKSYEMRGCIGCHGPAGRGGIRLLDARGHPVISRDLSAPWSFRGGATPEQIWLRLSTGLAPGPMPPLPADVTERERWDLVNYVVSLARTPPWQVGGKFDGPGTSGDLARRGEYLVHAEPCGLCHTLVSARGIYRSDDRFLAGGMRVGAYPHGTTVTPNLTSDSETGLGRRSEAEIVTALRDGRANGRVLGIYAMPWVYFHRMSDDDATAIARYLKTLTPVRYRIPAPLRYGFVETVMAKLLGPLPQAPTTVLTYADQGFGQTDDASRSWLQPASIQLVLVALQFLIILVGGIAVVSGQRANGTLRYSKGRRVAALSVAVVLGACGVVGAIIYDLPQLAVIPPQQIAANATAGIFEPEQAVSRGDDRTAMLNRGRYLFTIAACAMCHLNDGSGGLKVSWKPMGTVWASNLTSDHETGIGAWSDDEIERALRSGVRRNGGALHWQAMPWDHTSNWDEEDIRALIAYLRVLPPVHKQVPSGRTPASDDCEVYTFWTSASHSAGCGP
jgi:mono/diheme cytochrome c family protein